MKLLKCFVAQYKTRHIQSKNLEMHILRPKFSEKNTVKVQKQNYVSLINGLKTNFKVQIDLALIHLGSMALLALCGGVGQSKSKSFEAKIYARTLGLF